MIVEVSEIPPSVDLNADTDRCMHTSSTAHVPGTHPMDEYSVDYTEYHKCDDNQDQFNPTCQAHPFAEGALYKEVHITLHHFKNSLGEMVTVEENRITTPNPNDPNYMNVEVRSKSATQEQYSCNYRLSLE